MEDSVAALLRAHGLHPRKQLGQNFLADPLALLRIVDAADLSPQDQVIEVGAGLGALTRLLAERAGSVTAVELDDGLVSALRQRLSGLPNVAIVHGDILRLPTCPSAGIPRPPGWPVLTHRAYKVVANLPYYITSAVLRHFLEREPRPALLVVTVQREVAERIAARPGAMSLLAVSVQLYGHAHVVARLPPGAFYPPPEVESAVVRIEVSARPTVPVADEAAFFRAVRAGFSQKRKTLRNSLSAGLRLDPGRVEGALLRAGIDPRRRAETLNLEEWASAAGLLQAEGEHS